MTGPLFRLGFILACTLYVLALVLVADRWGALVAVIVGLVGFVLAVVLTEDRQPPAKPTIRVRRRKSPWGRRATRTATSHEDPPDA